MVKKLIVIYGANGAGKTTLAKKILGDEFTEEATSSGFVSVSKNKQVVAIGKYRNKCGGTDTIRETKELKGVFESINHVIENKECNLIVAEGMILSSVFGSVMKGFLDLKYFKGFDIELVFLENSIKTALNRVYNRNGKVMKLENITTKTKQVNRTFLKMAKTGEFHCFSIKTDALTEEQVFSLFVKNSKLYEV